jgi:hypothetical protein
MQPEPLGELPRDTPLYGFLAHDVLEKELGQRDSEPTFDIFALDGGPTVYLYADRQSQARLVCKFYGHKMLAGSRTGHREARAAFMHKEFESLIHARSLGLDTSHHNIVRPLAINEDLDFVLVEDFAPGNDLVFFVMGALQSDDSLQLRQRVSETAGFLADLHKQPGISSAERPHESVLEYLSAQEYLNSTADGLVYWQTITPEERGYFDEVCARWSQSNLLQPPHEVVIHGDANPTNFLWNDDNYLTVIDLEKLSWGDCAFDLGCVAAELKHLFWCHSGNASRSEPYIQHLYARYYDCLPPGMEDFASLTTRGRFYMGCIEMRIARNTWLDLGYRRSLVKDAKACLEI